MQHAAGSPAHRNKAAAAGRRYDLCGRAVARKPSLKARQCLVEMGEHGAKRVIVPKNNAP
jgi:hypothetical protein